MPVRVPAGVAGNATLSFLRWAAMPAWAFAGGALLDAILPQSDIDDHATITYTNVS